MLVTVNRLASAPGTARIWLALECGALFVGVPAAAAARWLPVPVIPLLLVMTAGCWLALRWQHKIRLRSLLRPGVPGREWGRVLAIYLAALPCLFGLLWWVKPSALFFLLRHHTGIWLLIMI
jgi:hypothetical protein